MSYSINQIDGLDEEEIKALKALGIRTTESLLEAARNPKGRRLLADQTGIDVKRILDCANACDHLRIKGMGKGYVGLLKAVGVATVRDLRFRNPANLAKSIADANKKRKLVRLLPSEKVVVRWVDEAKKLSLKITYKD
jgi:predicted RecB family nuclease